VLNSDDSRVHMWAAGRDKPEQVFLGHQSDVKCVEWHPQRALIASGSRDASIRLWDPKMGKCIRYIAEEIPLCVYPPYSNVHDRRRCYRCIFACSFPQPLTVLLHSAHSTKCNVHFLN
jgi:WD40 repeat protein